MNSVNISGNLTRDPELRATDSGHPVTTLSVAVSEGHKDKESGVWIDDEPTFVNVVVWGKRAEATCSEKGVRKGTAVIVSGKLYMRRWETETGDMRSILEVTADDLQWFKNN